MSSIDNLLTETMSGDDLDRQSAAAAALVAKVAHANGVSPDSLSEDAFARMMAAAGAPQPPTPVQEPVTMQKISHLDVTREMTKRANIYGVNLGELTKEQYENEFKALATRMADPEKYASECTQEAALLKQAQEHAETQVENGRLMARGFHDEMRKIAAEEEEEEKKKGKDKDMSGPNSDVDPKDKTASAASADSDKAIIETCHAMLKKANLSTEEFDKALAAALEEQKTAADVTSQAVELLRNLGYKVD